MKVYNFKVYNFKVYNFKVYNFKVYNFKVVPDCTELLQEQCKHIEAASIKP